MEHITQMEGEALVARNMAEAEEFLEARRVQLIEIFIELLGRLDLLAHTPETLTLTLEGRIRSLLAALRLP